MKKLIISSVLGVALAASTAFGQGYMSFGGSVIRDVWDANSGGTASPKTDSTFDATFLWSATATTSPMAGIGAFSSTNNASGTPTDGGVGGYSDATAWADIEASGWTAGTSGGTAIIGSPANSLGTFSYNSAAGFALDGSTGAGQAISVYVIAWEGGYSTLAAAEAANAPVGWTSVFSYTLAAAPPTTPVETVLPEKIGIVTGAAATPEPATLALAGLGGLSLLFLRRKKA